MRPLSLVSLRELVRNAFAFRTSILYLGSRLCLFFKPRENTAALVDFTRLPRHVAIIMDGNGRWAEARPAPHRSPRRAGAENFRTIATYCKKSG